MGRKFRGGYRLTASVVLWRRATPAGNRPPVWQRPCELCAHQDGANAVADASRGPATSGILCAGQLRLPAASFLPGRSCHGFWRLCDHAESLLRRNPDRHRLRQRTSPAMSTADVDGVVNAGLLLEAGPLTRRRLQDVLGQVCLQPQTTEKSEQMLTNQFAVTLDRPRIGTTPLQSRTVAPARS